jgi:CHAT domain-containing protein
MKKVISLLLIIFSFSQMGYSQSDVFEELKKTYDQLRKEGKKDSSLTVAKKMNAWAMQVETDSSLRYAISFRYVGNSFSALTLNDSALYYWNKSLKALENQHRAESLDAISCLYNIGGLYFKLKDYKSSETFFLRILEIRKRIQGKEHLDYAESLDDLAELYNKMNDFQSAENYFIQALEIRKKKLGEENLDYLKNLESLGIFYASNKKYEVAESYFKQVNENYEKVLGLNHPKYASSLNYLGLLYKLLKKFELSFDTYYRSLEITKKNYGENSTEYLDVLNEVIDVNDELTNYDSAIFFVKKAVAIKRNILGVNSEDYSNEINRLGNLYYRIGDYKNAQDIFSEFSQTQKIIYGEKHMEYAMALNNLGLISTLNSNYVLADSVLKKSISLFEESMKNTEEYIAPINNLGILNTILADFKSAMMYFDEVAKRRKAIYGANHPDYAISLNNLGILNKEIGNFKVSESQYKEALSILESNDLGYSENLKNVLHGLGQLNREMGDLKNAKIYLEKANELVLKDLSAKHPDYASGLYELGIILNLNGEYIEAENNLKSALQIYKDVYDEFHPEYAATLEILSKVQFNQKNFKLSETNIKGVLDIFKLKYGDKHPSFLAAQLSYAFLLLELGEKKQGYDLFVNIFNKKAKIVTDNFEWLSDNQKEAYWKKESSFYEDLSFFTNQVFQKVPEAAGLNYDAALLTKSKLLEAKITSEDFYLQIDELREEVGYRRRLLAKLESEGSLEKSKLDKLNFEVDSLDKRLTLSWPEYAQQKKNLQITWNQVQQNLVEGEAAIEFVRFENKSDSLIYYNALVLKKGDSQPRLIQLCAERDLQVISPEKGYSAYYGLVWQPLETALEGIKTIYYAPTGDLYNVPFHAIYAPKGTGDEIVPEKLSRVGNVLFPEYAKTEQDAAYLMDRYTLHQLTSTRYLAMGLKQKTQEAMGNTMAMVGAVNYDYLPGTIATPTKNKKGGSENRSSNYAYGKLDYLEGTKTEVDVINQQVSTASWETTVLEGNDAREEKITQLEGKESKEILHLATHGYAFSEFDYQDTTISQNSLKYSYRYSTNPMVRSGLILAGGNWAWTGSDTLARAGAEQNGILTALEVSQLNLKKTKLVVLSACETGLGKIEGNEGTFGLKRGFKLAGVEQLIVSLWSIPDQETQELMSLFYSDLTQTKSPTLSFQKAQQAMREKYPTSPFLWAGFVLVR